MTCLCYVRMCCYCDAACGVACTALDKSVVSRVLSPALLPATAAGIVAVDRIATLVTAHPYY